jgi:hypothetical protein
MNQSTLKLRRTIKYFVLLALFTIFATQACPTCIGHIKKKSPPFFSNEYYKPGSNNVKGSSVKTSENELKNKTKNKQQIINKKTISQESEDKEGS